MSRRRDSIASESVTLVANAWTVVGYGNHAFNIKKSSWWMNVRVTSGMIQYGYGRRKRFFSASLFARRREGKAI